MSDPSEELIKMIAEANELSAYIATLKRRRNRAKDINEKDRLTKEIKMKQYQALFYLEKMENLNQQRNKKV